MMERKVCSPTQGSDLRKFRLFTEFPHSANLASSAFEVFASISIGSGRLFLVTLVTAPDADYKVP
jgi:hypothetical protein